MIAVVCLGQRLFRAVVRLENYRHGQCRLNCVVRKRTNGHPPVARLKSEYIIGIYILLSVISLADEKERKKPNYVGELNYSPRVQYPFSLT